MDNFDVITIDGPASSGKTTIGLLFSQKIGYQFVDGGSLYRAITWVVLQKGILLDNIEGIIKVSQEIKIEYKMEDGKPSVYIDGENVTPQLNSPEVNEAVSTVAAIAGVRQVVTTIEKSFGGKQNLVLTGRAAGTESFPNARLKFYITAGPEVRARRRFEQLVKKGETVTLNQIVQDIKDRDHQDSTRETSPLRIPKNAIVIDNTRMNIEQTVGKMLENMKSDIVSPDCL